MLAFFVLCHTMANPLHPVDAVDNYLVAHQQRQQQKQQTTHHGALVIIMRLSSSKSAMATFVWCFTEALLSLLQQQQGLVVFLDGTSSRVCVCLFIRCRSLASRCSVAHDATALLLFFENSVHLGFIYYLPHPTMAMQFNSIQFNRFSMNPPTTTTRRLG
jgi:hypothetical protein